MHISVMPTPDQTDFRQLRHQTKNALQRILCQIAQSRELQRTPQGQRLVTDLERRVRLSATVSDALFGLTTEPGPLAVRLRMLAEAVVELMADPDQFIRLEVDVEPGIPGGMDDVILRITHEFVGNAVKHGMYSRTMGTIRVRVDRIMGGTIRVQVSDDGWGFKCVPDAGEGTRLVALMAEQNTGTAGLVRRGGLTVAEALLHPR